MNVAREGMLCLVAAASCMAPSLGNAGSLGVGPTLVELTGNRPVAVLHVRNTGESKSIVQVETLAWDQADGSDRYSPTDEVAASPEVFELAPGAQRDVRVGLRSASASTQGERSYRVYLREVLPKTGAQTQQLTFAVRIGVPVFASPTGRSGKPALSWQLKTTDKGCQNLAVRNDSPYRQHVNQLQLLSGEQMIWESVAPVYVLAGATRVLDTQLCGTDQPAQQLRVTGESGTAVLPASR